MICEKCGKEINFDPKWGYVRKRCDDCRYIREQDEDIRKRKSETLKQRVKKGIHFSPKLMGKDNPRYNENGFARLEEKNKKIKEKIFNKYNGQCQGCKRQILKNERWIAHHNQLNLTIREYMTTEDRTLYCNSCHTKYHNIKHPKKHFLGSKKLKTLP